MPRYSYDCEKCSRRTSFIRPVAQRDDAVRCSGCDKPMKRGLSQTSPATVKERVDGPRNIHQRADNDKRIRDRAKNFFVENEMPDAIAKEGVEEAKKKGWIKPDGKVVKKDDLK